MHHTTSIAILSGKGGVGKSNLALNISAALNQKKQNILLMDCDIGLANLDVLLGIAPEHNIQDIILGKKNAAEVCLTIQKTGDKTFDLLPGHSGLANLTEMEAGIQKSMQNNINAVAKNYDFLTLDLGAGIAQTVLAFGAMSDLRILVITPEPTSLTDSYALIKVLSAQYGHQSYHVIVNQTETQAEGKQTFQRLAAACERFLQITINYLGEVRYDANVIKAVRQQKPFINLLPASVASKDCIDIAEKILDLKKALKKNTGLALKDLPHKI